MGKKFSNEICVYCCERLANSADHIVARTFFPESERENLPKAPACKSCNSRKSKAETYLATMFLFGSLRHDAVDQLKSLGPRRLARNKKLQRTLRDGRQDVWVRDDRIGLYRRTMVIPFEGQALIDYSEYVCRGLLWHHWKQRVDSSMTVFASCLNEHGIRLFQALMAGPNDEKVEGSLGKKVLDYKVSRGAGENSNISAWLISYFGGVMVGEYEKVQTETSTKVGILVGPGFIVEKIREAASTS